MSRVPRIRFKGFEEDWEQRKLGEIADKVVEKNFQLQERDVFTNSAEFGIIDQKDFFDHEIVNKNNIGGYYIVSPNDFVYNPRISVTAPVGPINRNKLCKRGIMSPLYTVFHPRNMNETFLEFYFRTNKWHKFMEYNGDSGARSDRFSIKTELFYAMTIPFPSHKEQSKVGICFESLNHLITLHQRKLEKLKIIKKSMLENIFPQNGEKTPKIRFSGFTEDWEQRKLGEICQITMGQSPDGSTYSQIPLDYILVQGNADLKDGWVYPRIWTTQKTKMAEAGDLIMSVRAPAGTMGKTYYDVVIGRGVAGIKGSEFIYQALVKMDSNGYWKVLASGSTFESINSDVVNGAELMVTENIDEQNKIGDYLASIDYLITLHQSKLDKLQKIKKSMLESMFV